MEYPHTQLYYHRHFESHEEVVAYSLHPSSTVADCEMSLPPPGHSLLWHHEITQDIRDYPYISVNYPKQPYIVRRRYYGDGSADGFSITTREACRP